MAEPGLDRDGLVRDDPRRVARALIHLHREAHGRIDRADAARLERGDDVGADLVDLVAGPVEFEVGHRARRAAQRLAGHAYHEAEKRLGPGIVAQELVALRIEAGAGDFDEAHVGRAAIKGELTEPRCIDRPRRAAFGMCRGSQALHRRMVFEPHA